VEDSAFKNPNPEQLPVAALQDSGVLSVGDAKTIIKIGNVWQQKNSESFIPGDELNSLHRFRSLDLQPIALRGP
jgi:hypothetical protein